MYFNSDSVLSSHLACFQRKYPLCNFLITGYFNCPCIRWSEKGGFSFIHGGLQVVLEPAVTIMDEFTFCGLTLNNYIINYLLLFNYLLVPVSCYSRPLVMKMKLKSSCFTLLDIQSTPYSERLEPRYIFNKCDYGKVNEFLRKIDLSIF